MHVTLLLPNDTLVLQDGNLKVNLAAFECLPALCSGLRDGLEPCLATLLPPLLSGTTSTNRPLAAAAVSAKSALLSSVDARLLAQPLATIAEHGAVRLRPAALGALKELVGPLWAVKPSTVTDTAHYHIVYAKHCACTWSSCCVQQSALLCV
jgi:hypothetical protein